jgi:hypothetical protein
MRGGKKSLKKKEEEEEPNTPGFCDTTEVINGIL